MKYTLLTFLIYLVTIPTVQSQFAGGSGTENDPYQIETIQHLQDVRDYAEKYFIQIAEINASETINWNSGQGFIPIGDQTINFTGQYDGGHYQISGLYIDRDESRVGLFGYLKDGIVKNVDLIDVDITGSNYTGGLAGWSENSNIRNSSVTGNVEGSTGVGGLVGHNFFSAEIFLSKADVNVIGNDNVGGLVGNNWADIRQSNSAGTITSLSPLGSGAAGGLAGNNTRLIESSFSTAEVEGQEGVGGLVGENSGEIKNSYSLGAVNGNKEVGGFSGNNSNDSEISNSFSSGAVSGSEDVGGFAGVNGGTILSSYWDTQTSQQVDGLGRGFSTGVTGLTTEEFTGSNANENMSDFAFEIVWIEISDTYPKLLWSIPFYKIESIETNSPIVSGEVLNADVNLKNIGGITGESDVSLIDHEGNLIESSEQVTLENGEATLISLEWVSPPTESGEYEFTVEVQYEVVSVFIEIFLPPGIVNLISPSEVAENVPIDADFIWNEAENREQYKIQISDDEGFGDPIYNSTVNDTIYNLSQHLSYDSQYFWRVRAINEGGESEWSEIWSFITNSNLPEIVEQVLPENKAIGIDVDPKFEWREAENTDAYRLQLAINDNFQESELVLNFDGIEFTEFKVSEDLDSSTKYYWRIKAVNESGESEWSDTWSFTTGIHTSISEKNMPVEYVLNQNYPNPFNPVTTIHFGIPEAADVQFEVFNMLGQRVAVLFNGRKNAGWHKIDFDASDLSSGMYIYRIQAGEFVQTRKLTLIK